MIIIQHCDFSFKDIVGTIQLRLTTVIPLILYQINIEEDILVISNIFLCCF